jgi:ferredoxin-NADP reductase
MGERHDPPAPADAAQQPLRFLAGQRATLGLPAGVASGDDLHAELPVASCPCDDRNLIFHVRRRARRRRWLPAMPAFAGLHQARRMEVSVWGPWGRFVLERESTRPLVFVAIDDGFAPINSLIEHAIAVDAAESITLYWAATRPGGQYLPNQCRAWAAALDEFHYRPLRSLALATALAADAGLAGSPMSILPGPATLVEAAATALLRGRAWPGGATARPRPCSAMSKPRRQHPHPAQGADPALEPAPPPNPSR